MLQEREKKEKERNYPFINNSQHEIMKELVFNNYLLS
jgi:hypothetical protein